MTSRSLSIIAATVCVLSGCTTQYLTRDLLCDKESARKAASRAVRCMTAAGIEVAQKNPEESQGQTKTDKDEGKDTDTRYKAWIP
jgi:hypothetical protein